EGQGPGAERLLGGPEKLEETRARPFVAELRARQRCRLQEFHRLHRLSATPGIDYRGLPHSSESPAGESALGDLYFGCVRGGLAPVDDTHTQGPGTLAEGLRTVQFGSIEPGRGPKPD